MSQAVFDAPSVRALEVGPPPPRRRLHWRKALRALRELIADADDTVKAMEVFWYIDGDGEERLFQRFLASPLGRRLLAERPSLPDVLSDRAALAALPDGSFGRCALEHFERNDVDPAGLIALKDELHARIRSEEPGMPELDPAREWFRNRNLVTHDLQHVLTGYDTDPSGESVLLPFSWAQGRNRANGLLTFGVAAQMVLARRFGFLLDMWRAWRRSRRAAFLPGLPYEDWLPLPLEEVRALAGIDPLESVHPRGIPRIELDGSPAAA